VSRREQGGESYTEWGKGKGDVEVIPGDKRRGFKKEALMYRGTTAGSGGRRVSDQLRGGKRRMTPILRWEKR